MLRGIYNTNILFLHTLHFLLSIIRYKAWHSWAYMNFEAVLFYKHQGQNTSANQTLMGESTNKGLVSLKVN